MKKFLRVISISLFLLLGLMLAAAPQPEAPVGTEPAVQSGPYPLTVVDGLGNEVRITSSPMRIASLSLFSDEVLMDMIGPERLAAITSLASDEVYSNIADRAGLVEVQTDLNVESLIALGPDLIIAANWSDPGKVQQMRDAGFTVYLVNTPFSVEGIQAEIFTLGRILDEDEAASDLVAAMNATLDEVSAVLEDLPPDERLSALDYNSWGSASGGNSTWNAILQSAGLRNAVAGLEEDEYGQVPLSKESLLTLNPDILFLPGWIWGDPEGARAFADQVRNDPSLAQVAAVENDRLYMIPENLKSTYSHYLADAVMFVARAAYPEQFE